ncbi:MAG: hydrogenase maturation protease [Hydrogenophaga sp.]|jgi:hydrogenase maturation protease|uniref:hydrogenase maturation protease n=1 Tax=Hydrogenophaga sp. TaxID=1904254 RepID=UPI0027314E4C|nr:hydrogenase maturation protease [Hydrogenophaga sp.]MDP2406252.1 hydrogenase maturation protease [Hydrogenophaga sp.]MDZ4174589.1 hydrogenase maturation protease [Hydrogenophaga sp.]
MSSQVAPLLVFGWGNPSRGDDALGPLLVEQLAGLAQMSSGRLECLTDFQLQVEHALDLRGRERVLFVDAAIGLQTPFAVSTVVPAPVAGFTTHALSPEALLQVYRDLERAEPPPCTLLAIRAQRFELGEAPGGQALADLALALAWATAWAGLTEEMLT